jgi:uncharacterized membrane-anchored protein YhcB (DUF1043 family)
LEVTIIKKKIWFTIKFQNILHVLEETKEQLEKHLKQTYEMNDAIHKKYNIDEDQ